MMNVVSVKNLLNNPVPDLKVVTTETFEEESDVHSPEAVKSRQFTDASIKLFKSPDDECGKSIISYKDRESGDVFSTVIKFVEPENRLILESKEENKDRQAKVKIARQIAKQIKETVQNGQSRYLSQEQKRTTYRNFLGVMLQVARELNLNPLEVCRDYEIVILTAYNCLETKLDKNLSRQNKKEEGFLEAFPDGILKNAFLEKTKILAKHYLIDICNLDSPLSIEKLNKTIFEDSGLFFIADSFKLPDLFRLMFPGYLDCENPCIRQWHIEYDEKWSSPESKELISRALRVILRYDLGVIKEDWSYSIADMEEVPWGAIFNDKKYGLQNAIKYCSYIDNSLEAVELAFPSLVGINEGQLLPWQICFNGMWQIEHKDGKKLIDKVTIYLIERKLKCVDNGRVSGKKIKQVPSLEKEYNLIVSGCLKQSQVKTKEALRRVYPEIFGLCEDQIRPWEMPGEGIWDGDKGKSLFRIAFTFCLFESSLGNLDLSQNPPVFTFTLEQYEKWDKNELRGKNQTLRDLITDYGLSGGLKGACGGNLNEAIRILFDINESDMPGTRDTRTIIKTLLQRKIENTEKPTVGNLRGREQILELFEEVRAASIWDLIQLRDCYKNYRKENPYLFSRPLTKDTSGNFTLGKYIESVEGDKVFNFVKLAYDMLLYSLKNNYSIEQVFKHFAVANIDINEDDMEYAKLHPYEVFNLACNLNRLEISDSDLEDDKADIKDTDYLSAVKMLIKAFEIPDDEGGRELLNEFIWGDENANIYVDVAFEEVEKESYSLVLRAA